jgi:hypothetical protein
LKVPDEVQSALECRQILLYVAYKLFDATVEVTVMIRSFRMITAAEQIVLPPVYRPAIAIHQGTDFPVCDQNAHLIVDFTRHSGLLIASHRILRPFSPTASHRHRLRLAPSKANSARGVADARLPVAA